MKLSIIIPVYNEENTIEILIKKVLNNQYSNKEMIIIDDYSTDNSLKILNTYKKKIKVIKNKKKTRFGSFNQINAYYKGFLASRGSFIFFLDSDDFYNKEKLKIVIKKFETQRHLNIIFDLPILKFKRKIKKNKFNQKSFIFSNWPRFTPQSCISLKRHYAKELFLKLNLKKFETLWFDFRIASYTYIRYRNIYILKNYLTYYRQLDNSASKEYKFFSKKWWFRRKQAHDFIDYLSKKTRIKNKTTLDKFLTSLINLIFNPTKN